MEEEWIGGEEVRPGQSGGRGNPGQNVLCERMIIIKIPDEITEKMARVFRGVEELERTH